MLHSYFTGVVLSPRFKYGVLLCYIRTLLMLFCLLDLSWSTFVLHSYFIDVILSPRFKLEYFCATFVLYWCCFVSSI